MVTARHVEPNVKGGWSVRAARASRASRIFDTRAEAVEHADALAAREEGTVYVHGKDGSIRTKRSFAKEGE